MHFSTVAIPALAGVALAAQKPATGTQTSQPNSCNAIIGGGRFPDKTPFATKVNNPTTTTRFWTTTTCVTTPEVTVTTVVPSAPTATVTPGITKFKEGTLTVTKTVPYGTKTVTSDIKAAPVTPVATMSVNFDDPSDNLPPVGAVVHVFSPVVTSGATRRVQVPGIFRLPVQLWKAVSGLFLQGAVVNSHGTTATVTTTSVLTEFSTFPQTVTAPKPKTVTTTMEPTTVKAIPSVTTQTWDRKNDGIPPQTVVITFPGGEVLVQDATTTTTSTVTSTPSFADSTTTATSTVTSTSVLPDPTTVHPTTTTSTVGGPTFTETLDLPVVTSGATRNGPPAVVSMAVKAWRYFN
ncbi:hypothetical protein NpNSSI1_00003508 [Neofusicoccum parvum]|nr:hypothetical protein NpNSSI1_00003508 [Neofusicoccum parvum]